MPISRPHQFSHTTASRHWSQVLKPLPGQPRIEIYSCISSAYPAVHYTQSLILNRQEKRLTERRVLPISLGITKSNSVQITSQDCAPINLLKLAQSMSNSRTTLSTRSYVYSYTHKALQMIFVAQPSFTKQNQQLVINTCINR